MSVLPSFPLQAWENENGPRGATNTAEGLTHSSDTSREGLGMKPTRSVPPTKRCAKCGEDLPSSSFTPDPRMASGLKSYCRECCKVDARSRYAANPERAREISRAASRRRYSPELGRRRHLKAMYGLGFEDYQALLNAQAGRCAICTTDTPGGKGDWHVDHCHDTGKVRALLCANCNVGIGLLKHDADRLRAAAHYIESHQESA